MLIVSERKSNRSYWFFCSKLEAGVLLTSHTAWGRFRPIALPPSRRGAPVSGSGMARRMLTGSIFMFSVLNRDNSTDSASWLWVSFVFALLLWCLSSVLKCHHVVLKPDKGSEDTSHVVFQWHLTYPRDDELVQVSQVNFVYEKQH